MAKYRKKPLVIEATQWFKNGDHPQDKCWLVPMKPGEGEPFLCEGVVVRRFSRPGVPGDQKCKYCDQNMDGHGWIDTLEGGHIVCPGDFIITGAKGERYPCKPDIFLSTYDKEFEVNDDNCPGCC